MGTHCWCRALLIFLALTFPASAEWKEKVLYSFQDVPDGAVPVGAVVFDKAGNLYGATENGGASTCDGPEQCGTVYQLKPPAQKGGAWTETVLYIFKGHVHNDGATPTGGLVIDEAGNLYGVTGYGGSGPCTLLGGAVGCGAVYELSPPSKQGDPWKETVLYSFQGGKDGFVGWGDLVFDNAGNLYGATLFGGGKGTTCNSLYGGQCGTIFELSPPKVKGDKWVETVLHSFAGGADGANPNGGLVFDSKGAVYGTTSSGGNHSCKGDGFVGCGTLFKLIPSAERVGGWREDILHRFTGGIDGGTPSSGLTLDSSGGLLGTGGGGINGLGAVYEFSADGGRRWVETVIYSFAGGDDGRDPLGPVTLDRLGNAYGTTSFGTGTVFRLVPPTERGGRWHFETLYSFHGSPDGRYPTARLTLDKTGTLFSTTELGGDGQACQGGCGTVFETNP